MNTRLNRLSVGAISVLFFILAQGCGPLPDPPNMTPPPFLPSASQDTIAPVPRLPANADTEAIMQRLEKDGKIVRSRISGPETAGSTIEVAGEQIKLPKDTYVYAYVLIADCVVGTPCPDPPIYVLQTGDSRINIEKRSGDLWNEVIALGDVDPFDFLKKGRIIHPVTSGPATAGATVTVAGKEIKLPADTIVSLYVTSRNCGNEPDCPDVPRYVLKRGESFISVEETSGKLWHETIGPGEVNPFEFLKAEFR